MSELSWRIELGDRYRVAACDSNAHDRARACGHKQDRARIPGRTTGVLCIGENVRRSANNVDAVEPTGGKKANRAAVRRPERTLSTLRARHRPRVRLIERTQPEPRRSVAGSHEDQKAPIGREREFER